MPVVPIPERWVDPGATPTPGLTPSLPSQAFTGLQPSGRAAEGLLADIYEEEKRKLDYTAVLDADQQLSETSTRLLIEAQNFKGRDAVGALDHVKNQWDETAKQIKEGLANDEQKFSVENRALQHWTTLNNAVNRYVNQENNRYAEEVKNSWIINKANSVKANYADPEAVENAQAEIKAVLRDYHKRQGNPPESAEVEFQKYKDLVYQSASNGIKEDFIFMVDNIESNRGRLAHFVEELTATENGQYKNFPYLDPSDRRTMLSDVEKRMDQADKEREAGIKKAQEVTGNVFIEKLVNGTLTRTEILKSNLEPTGENSKKTWIEEIEQREKAKTETIKTDKVLEGDLYAKIVNDAEAVSEFEILRHVGTGLTKESAKELIDERTRRIEAADPFKDQKAKTAIQILNFARSQKLFDEDVAKNNEAWSEYSLILRDFIQNHPEEDPVEFVNNEIMAPVERDFMGALMDKFVIGAPSLEQKREIRKGALKKQAEDPLRSKAIEFLNSKGWPTDEKNINFVMDKMREK